MGVLFSLCTLEFDSWSNRIQPKHLTCSMQDLSNFIMELFNNGCNTTKLQPKSFVFWIYLCLQIIDILLNINKSVLGLKGVKNLRPSTFLPLTDWLSVNHLIYLNLYNLCFGRVIHVQGGPEGGFRAEVGKCLVTHNLSSRERISNSPLSGISSMHNTN